MLLVFGAINLDHTCFVENLPRPGETVLGHKLHISPGGKGANQAYNAAKMKASTIFIAAHGRDSQAEKALANLQKVGVRTNQCTIKRTSPTGFAMISVDEKGENSIIVIAGANAKLEAKTVKPATLKACAFLLTQMEVNPAETLKLMQMAKDNNTKIIHSHAPFKPMPPDLFSHIDYLLLNQQEAVDLGTDLVKYGYSAEMNAIAQAFNMEVIVTAGAQGVTHFAKNGTSQIFPVPNIAPIDTTGAGDCFAGVFAAALDAGFPITKAIEKAIYGAKLHCLQQGAQPEYPRFDEVFNP